MDNLFVEKKINNLIMKEKWSADLFTELKDNFDVIIFGGAIRDILYGQEQNIRDIDIVLCPKNESNNVRQDFLLSEIIDRSCSVFYCRNQFHGYKLMGNINTMDIWLLKDTWAFQQELLPVSPQNLLKSVYLNIDAYAWNYNRKQFISKCDRMKIKIIDIVLEETACEYLNLVRAVVFGQKYNMYLSDKIISKLYEMLKYWSKIETEVLRSEKNHYGFVMITEQDIRNTVERQQINHEKYML